MKSIFFYILLPVLYLIPFEVFTHFLHKYVMHGFGWGWHKSHHHNPGGGLEENDLYAVCFAILSVSLFYIGSIHFHSYYLLSIAIGLTLYGACYFFVHDILIHRRINNKLIRNISNRYIKRLVRAHAIHHKIKEKKGAQAFGFLYAPRCYDTQESRKRKTR